eukprot:CAMPEP_0167761834 /NCGR_PEP_ID=MMETSP0110_2-20121227/12403_1 /TAXON_ID=629695 /ORGANISM="Gymnochlora sp., Strain CCMP2014" /LENGTH=149 /DNA_ID=CAMNT_0007648583 /DNA_START=45 /DNA_END=490 /DNA_ORIENTATION=+
MAVVSADHGSEDLNPSHISISSKQTYTPRPFYPSDIHEHNKDEKNSFLGIIDGYVCDCSNFVNDKKMHPGGIKKLLSTNEAKIGATGKDFGFSFTRGRNAHFPDTGKTFQEGVKAYLNGSHDGNKKYLAPQEVNFKPRGKVVIVGVLVL